MSWAIISLACYCLVFGKACGLGCINFPICEDQEQNEIANARCDRNNQNCECYADAKHCGVYNSKRKNNSLVKGVDIRCDIERLVYAPFDGNLSFYRPFGGQNTTACLDQGLEIVGTGTWAGYIARIAFIAPFRYSGQVRRKEKLGVAIDHGCTKLDITHDDEHILFQLIKEGKPIDPTYRLTQCMCTGQICESNPNNALLGSPFMYKPDYGKGYEIRCPDIKDKNGSERAPFIFNPIKALALGRFRPFKIIRNASFTCDNDGIFLEGRDVWKDFFVHIYNVQFEIEPNKQELEQGKIVARRLNCPGKEVNSIFVEFRYKGRLVDISKMVSADNCSLPILPD